MWQTSDFGPKAENLDCIHCGLCLSSCPTYSQLWREADSPRGRIYLINAASEGKIEMDGTFQQHIDLCLGCRACESACPSGVQFGSLLTSARERMEVALPRSGLQAAIRKAAFQYLLPNPRLLHVFFRLARWAQNLRLDRLGRIVPPGSLLGRSLEQLANLPPIDPRARVLSGFFPARAEARQRVAFFRGCVMNEACFPAQRATLHVLNASGCEVEVTEGQTCCGALHDHNGERDQARDLAWRNIQAFGNDSLKPIVTNSAGCGALLKHYDHLFDAGDPRRERARGFSARVRDLSEFLAKSRAALPLRLLRARVTYDDPCHLIHGQRISQQPRLLLQQIPGLEYVELARASWCCGGAGSYSLTQPEMSARILRDKIENIAATEATAVVTANPGCMLQLAAGLRKAGLKIEVLHLAEILSRSISAGV
ncbi:MAG: (Fe-S)-binding protein [Acidobacteria bacterium]|nr:(Fe-S)-binding protein [Acidobacteriota bacterium]